VRQVDHLQELYRDARSTEHKGFFNVLLTEYHGTILVNHQLDAQILYF
jgi:hypothetical protein